MLNALFCNLFLTGLFQLAQKFTSMERMLYAHYRYLGTLAATRIWEFSLQIQFLGISFMTNYNCCIHRIRHAGHRLKNSVVLGDFPSIQ